MRRPGQAPSHVYCQILLLVMPTALQSQGIEAAKGLGMIPRLVAIFAFLWIGVAIGADLPIIGRVNPDVTQDNIKDTICVSGWTKTVRPPASYTNRLKAKQLGVSLRSRVMRRYEEDHYLAIENGGHPRDPNNLVPQLWTGACNARQKDRVENAVHKMICSGEMTLEEGQAAQMDWKTFYRDNIDSAGCE